MSVNGSVYEAKFLDKVGATFANVLLPAGGEIDHDLMASRFLVAGREIAHAG